MLVGLLTAIGAAYIAVAVYTTRIYQQEIIQGLHRELARNLVTEPIPVQKSSKLDVSTLEGWFRVFMVANPSIELYLLDRSGNIVSHPVDPSLIHRSKVSLEPIERFLSGDATLPIMGDDPRALDRQKVFSVAPVIGNGEVQGYLYAILGGEHYATVMQLFQRSYVLRLSIALVAVLSLMGLVAGVSLFRLLTSRVRRLSQVIDEFQRTGRAPRLGRRGARSRFSGDEVDRLEASFDGMAERISEQVAMLEKADTVRRELIAGVSHDLRTPLTSLRGYLETLSLKEGDLDASQRREYLDAAIKHGIRLSTLIGELAELARLDAPRMQPHFEAFPIAELVQDVLQKFALQASEQHSDLSADLVPDLPLVHADIGLIDRVFENLISNALRYTPEGGKITVSLAAEGGGVRVAVSDTGPGIPAEVLPRIFDRFARYGPDAQRDSAGMGLGLAIAKRILELHGSSIEVDSTLGAGSTFSFRLPIRPSPDL